MDNNKWDFEVMTAAVEIKAAVGSFVANYETACALARERAGAYPAPECDWFFADVLNAVNELDMEEE